MPCPQGLWICPKCHALATCAVRTQMVSPGVVRMPFGKGSSTCHGSSPPVLASHRVWWQQRHAPCPIDPVKAAACMRLRRLNKWLLGVAWAAYACGIFFAYLWIALFY